MTARSRESVSTRRLFVAIDPPADPVRHLAQLVETLHCSRTTTDGRSTRMTPTGLWHITIAFLGDVPQTRADQATAAVGRAVTAARPLSLCFAGGGRFGDGRSAILWAGVGGDVDGLCLLAGIVREELRRVHIPFDDRRYQPHLTLSKPGERTSPAAVEADLATLVAYRGPQWRVDQVHVVSSDDAPHPSYSRIASFDLPGDEAP